MQKRSLPDHVEKELARLCGEREQSDAENDFPSMWLAGAAFICFAIGVLIGSFWVGA